MSSSALTGLHGSYSGLTVISEGNGDAGNGTGAPAEEAAALETSDEAAALGASAEEAAAWEASAEAAWGGRSGAAEPATRKTSPSR